MSRNDDARSAVLTVARLARLLERSSEELSLGHYRVLALIGAGDHRASRLAERLAVGKPAVSAAVLALEARGLLKRFEVEGDQRATRLELTPEGADVLARAEIAMAASLRELVELSGDERPLTALRDLGFALDRRRSLRDKRAASGA